MKLGNSNGANKGKKYFVRGRDDQNLDVVYAEKAELFSKWFALNLESTRLQLLDKNNFDDDVMNETYVKVYEIILFTGRHIKDYASYFHRAYFTNYINGLTKENRYCPLYPNYDTVEEDDIDYFEEIELKGRLLGEDIMDYVYEHYPLQEFEIFKMYINLKPAINYHSLAKMTDLKYYVIQRMISKIIMDVQTNRDFLMRRGHVARA